MGLKASRQSAESDSKLRIHNVGIQRRLTIFTVALVVFLSSLLGGALIQQGFGSSIESIRSDLRAIADQIASSDSDKMTIALSLVQDATTPISIFLTDETGERTPVLEASAVELPKGAKSLVGTSNRIEGSGRSLYTLVPLEGESQLLLVASTEDAFDKRTRDLRFFIGALLAILLFSIFVLRRVIARDVERERTSIENEERLRLESEQRMALLDFAGDASHELRTPLTVIKGYLELLQRGLPKQDVSESLARMLKETHRMEQTVDQLLDYFATGNLAVDSLQAIDLSKFVSERVETFVALNEGRKIHRSIESELHVSGDQETLSRIVDNALMNIRRHTQETAPVEIRLFREGSRVVLEIHDGGPGILDVADENSPRPFRRYDRSRSRLTGGSGLGMSIMKTAMEKLQGDLKLGKSHLGGLVVRLSFQSIP